jgi:hypothetical protein
MISAVVLVLEPLVDILVVVEMVWGGLWSCDRSERRTSFGLILFDRLDGVVFYGIDVYMRVIKLACVGRVRATVSELFDV